MSNPAASARRSKERNPSAWCKSPRCLFRTDKNGRYVPCPRHGDLSKTISSATEVEDIPSPAQRLAEEYDAP